MKSNEKCIYMDDTIDGEGLGASGKRKIIKFKHVENYEMVTRVVCRSIFFFFGERVKVNF